MFLMTYKAESRQVETNNKKIVIVQDFTCIFLKMLTKCFHEQMRLSLAIN